jgi:hypothetical protein
VFQGSNARGKAGVSGRIWTKSWAPKEEGNQLFQKFVAK